MDKINLEYVLESDPPDKDFLQMLRRSIEADGVGMHTEVREPKNSRALIPIIYSSEPELAMVKHFLAPKDDKKYTLSIFNS